MSMKPFLILAVALMWTTVIRGANAQYKVPDTVVPPVKTESGIEASIVDTRTMFPAIDNRPRRLQMPPENPIRKPRPGREKLALPIGGIDNLAATVNPGTQFAGMTMNGFYPPDPDVAVGKSHIVQVVNSSFAIYSKDGTKQLEQGFDIFLKGAETFFLYDPRVIYDRFNDRFVMIVHELIMSPKVSKMWVAISDDGDPNGRWNCYRLEAKLNVGGVDTWIDQATIGYNQDGYVISGNMFTFGTSPHDGTFKGAAVIVVPSGSLMLGGTLSTTTFLEKSSSSIRFAQMLGEATSVVYGICRGSTNTTLTLWAIQKIKSTPTMIGRSFSVPSWVDPPTTLTSTNGRLIELIDDRLISAVWRGGGLVTAHTVGVSNRAAVRWYDVATNGWPVSGSSPMVEQTGQVADSTKDYAFASASRNAAGQIGLTFSHISTTTTGSVMVAGRYLTDVPGTVGTPLTLATSAGNNYKFERWGDYSGMDTDPIDDSVFWLAGMTVASNNEWRTHIESFRLSTTLALTRLSLGQVGVTGGNPFVATVWLNFPAPEGGTVVMMGSDNVAARVPASVTVPAGANSAQFDINTTAVVSNARTLITATLGASSKTATIDIYTPSLSSLVSSSASIVGGNQVSITANLNAPAPVGGITVALASTDLSAFPVPSTIFIAEGKKSGDVLVTTGAVSTDKSVTVKGTCGGSASVNVLVKAPTLTSLVPTQTALTGGSMVSLRVQLDGVAPSGGVSVKLKSSNVSAMKVPSTITIVGGSSYVDLLVTAGVVPLDVTVTVTATLGTVNKEAKILVKAASISALVPARTVLIGGSTVSVRVQLDGAAPTGGTTVTLESANSGIISLPLKATIPAGATSVNVDAVSSAVATDIDVAITATLGTVSKSATLTVVAPVASSLTVSPASVLGGDIATATVTLSGPAPTGGRIVDLLSNLAAASVPASVTVAAGASTATFTVATTPLAYNAIGTLSATNNGVTVSTPLIVRGPIPLSVTVYPLTVAGGNNSGATVMLEQQAPAGGVIVELGTDVEFAVIPSSVFVPAGERYVSVTITTKPVSSIIDATISASINGETRTGLLKIVPPIIRTLTFAPSSVTGGLSTSGMVTLQTPAPAGGTVVNLKSANPLVIVPATVTVSANAKTAVFTVSTGVSLADTNVFITGTTGTVSASGTLKVLVPRVSSLSFQSSSPVGGSTIVGTIKLTGKASVKQCFVSLKNGLDGIIAPTTVVVNAGLDTATFSASLPVVAVDTVVPWKASLNGAFKTFSMTIKPAAVLAVTFSPVSAPGGAPMTGKVTLTGQAPDGGTTVSLVSALPGIASVPAFVVVPAGATNVSFPVTTVPVVSDTNVSITATTGAISKVGTARFLAPVVTAFLTSSSTLQGGKTLSGRVNISGTAPAGGVIVTLSSSDASVSPPLTIIVPEGTKTVGFSIPTSAVTVSTAVTLTATTGTTSKSVVVTITP